ncbi:DHHW family protein [Paenibacillus sp. ClWae2A]|uniref:DHHW family protein n=1 Tax=Paenibacillus sp. ClWae2A TaxID=3057177 RepID=UPI0028F6A1C2|nr:DHHW family protein [Paenibacillus sp. ClWae2A]MDT9717884.1 DHHW family protein [Paenibacillus sp. ClWae2A]
MSKYDKRVYSITGLSMLLYIGVIVILNVVTPDKTLSESENRVLERRPFFSLQSFISGAFTIDYEKYVIDQFAMRDYWIGIKTDTDRVLGKRESNGVYLGSEGHLIQSFRSPVDADVKDRFTAIHAFHKAMPELRKSIMLAPTAATLYQDKLPVFAPVDGEHSELNKARKWIERMEPGIHFIDVYAALNEKREDSIYYKTDHHWTTQGAYYAYQAWCIQMRFVPQAKEEFEIRQVTDVFYGSLYSKSGYRHVQPDRIDLFVPKAGTEMKVEYVEENIITKSLYKLDNLDKKDKYTVFMDGNHALVRITSKHEGGKKLLVVKDSYANSFIPFLTNHFTEIDVIDLRYYDESLTELAQDRQYDEMLMLYNIQTFFDDPFILNIAD